MCDRDCFNCTYEDCVIDSIDFEEMRRQNEMDAEIKEECADRQKKRFIKYSHSEKGKKTRHDYWEKNKDRLKEYHKKYNQRPEVKLRRREYAKARYWAKKGELV